MKTAIVCLTRGYDQVASYSMLIDRNLHIKKHIIDKHNLITDIIIFHQGNITIDHQQFISDKSQLKLHFVDISSIWNENISGYNQMCRFNMFFIWHFTKEYDAILRIDEDCYVIECNESPFEILGDNVFLRSINVEEGHVATANTLPFFINSITKVAIEEFYNNLFPYTNVLLSTPSFWLNDPVHDILCKIALNEDQLIYRWGDLPVLGSLLNIFAKGRVSNLSGMVYRHRSHINIIDCTTETYTLDVN